MPSTDLTPYQQPQGTTSDGSKFDNLLSSLQTTLNGLDDANIAPGASIALSKLAMNPLGQPLALAGATAAARFVGGTASGAPASGTFAVGDFVIDQTGKVFICTVAGTSGTWVQVAAGGGGGGGTTYRKTTAKTVNGTVAETDLLNSEITIAANPGTGAVIRLTAWGDLLGNNGVVAANQWKLKLGATTIFDTAAGGTTLRYVGSATRFPWKLVAEIQNLGAANSQLASLQLTYLSSLNNNGPLAFATGEGTTIGLQTGGTGTSHVHSQGFNTSAVDTTSSQSLVFSVIQGNANAAVETKLYGALVEIV